MTATVTYLASRRPRQRTRETCPTCVRGTDGCWRECYPHRIESLAVRLRDCQTAHAHELLIPTTTLACTLTDALAVLDGIARECLTEDAAAVTSR